MDGIPSVLSYNRFVVPTCRESIIQQEILKTNSELRQGK